MNRILAIDTSTDIMSLALGAADADANADADAPGGGTVHAFDGPGGAQASAALIPALLQLLAQAAIPLDAVDLIAFGAGPGSFTGLRTACAVAQGLAFGARGGRGIAVLPVDSLLAVAEDARWQLLQQGRLGAPDEPLCMVAALDARMDEVYAARFAHDGARWQPQGDFWLGAPEQLVLPADAWLVGNTMAAYPGRLPASGRYCAARPSAQALLRLAPQCLAQGLALDAAQALPRYVRDKVALTSAERQAGAAARVAAAQPGPQSGAQPAPQSGPQSTPQSSS